MNIHFSSNSNEWATPQDFFDALDKEFNFTLDPCATKENTKCAKYYTEADNGLAQSWDNEIVFCNPPYGRSIKHWVEKASEATGGGSSVIDTSPYRHHLLSRPYLQQIRDTVYSWAVKIWRTYQLRPISIYGSSF